MLLLDEIRRAFAHRIHRSAHIRLLAEHDHRRRSIRERSRRNSSSPDMPGSRTSVITQPSVSSCGCEVAFGAVVILYFGVERTEQ